MSSTLSVEVEALQGLGVDALRERWRMRFGEPPTVRSADLLRRLLAEKLQMAGTARNLRLERELDQLVRTYRRGAPVAAHKARFSPGVILVREHAGQRHRVEVVEGGFLYDGRRWTSLSQIAREITGVRWNGPRFFGLREEGR